MRPVNLIPPEERRGERAPLRNGPLAYVVVGALAVALLAITAIVMTGNSISEKEAELAALEARETEARARAEALAPFAQFATLSQARDATVRSLAESRFDWERVLRELSRVITEDVWLTSTTGTVAPEVQLEGASSIAQRAEIAGPALEIVGCGVSQDAVAEFVAALNDIDGVTRVALVSSERDPEVEPASSSESAEGDTGGGEDCRTRDFIALFEIVVAFDAVPAPAAAAPATDPNATATTAAPGTTPPETNSATEQTGEAGQAASALAGGGTQ